MPQRHGDFRHDYLVVGPAALCAQFSKQRANGAGPCAHAAEGFAGFFESEFWGDVRPVRRCTLVDEQRFPLAPLPFSSDMNTTFLRHWLQDPISVGAIAPSSRHLAAAMAEETGNFDTIVEVGAGTGAITAALVKRNPEARLVVFELSQKLAHGLQTRFPQAEVIAGAFHENVSALHDLPPKTVVVSALPFRSLPPTIVGPTVEALADVLRVDGARRLVQFSYWPRVPFAAPADFSWLRIRTVWRNAPPANVWKLHSKPNNGSSPS